MSLQLVKMSEIAPQMQDCDFPLKPVKTNKKQKTKIKQKEKND